MSHQLNYRDKIAVAIGDPHGIGPEIAIRAAVHYVKSDIQPVLVGDQHVIAHYFEKYAADLSLHDFLKDPSNEGISFVDVASLPKEAFNPGELNPLAGKATVDYVAMAVEMVRQKQVRAVVGCPHSETAINAAGIIFSGYPSLIAQLMKVPEDKVFLMLVANEMRIAHVTLHESVLSALRHINTDLIVSAGIAAVKAAEKLGIKNPKLGVFGINPHAGEDGLFGDEDQQITLPAVLKMRELGIEASLPTGGDVLLGQRKYDVYLAMFHDQGHIPIKVVSPLWSSALAIGSDLQFSSVGHGSAFDIAGYGVADPTSVIKTLQLLHSAVI
jgi:4-hydroxy-L-threonine phosphate dehydrogenase PdxA